MGNADKRRKSRWGKKRVSRRFAKSNQTNKENVAPQPPAPPPAESASATSSVATPSGSNSKESEKMNPSSTEDFNFLMNTASLSEVFDFAQTDCKGCGYASYRTVKVDASRKIALSFHVCVEKDRLSFLVRG